METRIPENPATEQNQATEEQIEQINSTLQRIKEYAAQQAKSADRLVRNYPYPSLGIAMGLGIIIGLLLGRRRD
jgi:ElaB/YqjD/DUF883 family membrane-anchored ribosome-binding protein